VDSFIKDAVAVVTNIRGPVLPVTVAGTPVAHLSLLVPSTGSIGIGISVFSYAGTATISVITDTAALPNAGSLTSAIEQRLAELRRG